ncbi:hypothetical protein ADUPG1_002650, partial [Aduncisulcus paluster]
MPEYDAPLSSSFRSFEPSLAIIEEARRARDLRDHLVSPTPPLSTPSSSSMSSIPILDPPVSMLSPRHIPDEFILKALFSLCQNIVP